MQKQRKNKTWEKAEESGRQKPNLRTSKTGRQGTESA